MAEPSLNDKENVRRLIVNFYNFAAIELPNWDGTVNDGVVAVFTTMYRETVKCSKAFALVPVPPAGPASYFWLATQLGGASFKRIQGSSAKHAPGK